MMVWLAWILGVQDASAQSLEVHDHVVVILDTSQSMKGKDAERRAKTAAALLYDLVDPLDNGRESFGLLAFEPYPQLWTTVPRQAAPPAMATTHDQVTRWLEGQDYDDPWTHYAPSLTGAVESLRQTPGGLDDRRVIFMITDGLPEQATRDVDLAAIQSLHQTMLKEGIQLYVLGFGTEASGSDATSFFEAITNSGAQSLGAYLTDPNGDQLLGNMIEIFGEAFGYTSEAPRALVAASKANLKGPGQAADAMVVAYGHGRPPDLSVANPSGREPHWLGSRSGVEGLVTGAAWTYRLVRVGRPDAASYDVGPAAAGVQYAVLRKTEVRVRVRDPAGQSTSRVMAGEKLPLLVETTYLDGGRPPPLSLQGQLRELAPDGSEAGDPFAPRGETAQKQARTYEIEPSFPQESPVDWSGSTVYWPVFVRVAASLRKARMPDAPAFPVHVYPRMRFTVTQRVELLPTTGQKALGRGERGCGRFEIGLTEPDAPVDVTGTGALPLLAQLDSDPALLEDELAESSFTLSHPGGRAERLDQRGVIQPNAPASPWSQSIQLKPGSLLGTYEVCVEMGTPTKGGTREIPLELTLDLDPYDRAGVMPDVLLVVQSARPPLLHRMGWLLLLLLLAGMLAVISAVGLGTDLPPDLCFRLTPENAPRGQARHVRGTQSAFGKLSGYPIQLPTGRRIGNLKPTRQSQLFLFKPARGGSVRVLGRTEMSKGGYQLRTAHDYRVEIDGKRWTLRLQYGLVDQ